MDASNLSIREINSLFTKKELKPSELYSKVFENAANSEAALHAHLTLFEEENICLLYTSPSPRDSSESRMPSSA